MMATQIVLETVQIQTQLSQHSTYKWKLKDENKNFNIRWKIIDRGKKFNQRTRKCNLCLKEKYNIIFKPSGATLNRRSELFSVCTHRWQKLLSKVWGRKFSFRFGKHIKTPRNSLLYPLRCWRLWYLCVIWNKFVQPYMFFIFSDL